MTSAPPAWLQSFANWLTPRRLRAQATVLALCLCAVCAVDYLTPGVFDRGANIKFQDFLTFYISAEFVSHGRAADLYNEPARTAEMLRIARPIDVARASAFPPTAHTPLDVRLPNLYGPQVALLLLPLTHFTFLTAAEIWVALNLILYFVCIHLVLQSAPALRQQTNHTVYALAFPPLFHFFVRGQLSVLVLACFTAAFLAFRANRSFLAGFALGLLAFKPQFLVAVPLIFLLSRSFMAFTGLVASAAMQLALTRLYFGPGLVRAYFNVLLHMARATELSLAPIQMHSLRSFWTLLIPQTQIAFALYVLTSIITVAIAARIWKSSAPLALRFSALTIAAVLANPHLFVYDLLVLAPVFLLLAELLVSRPDSSTSMPTLAIKPLLYLAFVLPLVGPLSRWTHLQPSVLAFAALLYVLAQISRPLRTNAT